MSSATLARVKSLSVYVLARLAECNQSKPDTYGGEFLENVRESVVEAAEFGAGPMGRFQDEDPDDVRGEILQSLDCTLDANQDTKWFAWADLRAYGETPETEWPTGNTPEALDRRGNLALLQIADRLIVALVSILDGTATVETGDDD